MSRALWFLLLRSARGRVVRRVRRLRQPKYLFGFLIGGGWVLFWISRFATRRGRIGVEFGGSRAAIEMMATEAGGAIQLVVCLFLAVGFSIWWLLPFGKRALELTEPELHVLLPAPLRRRQIIQYAILRSQPGVLVGASILTFFWGGRTGNILTSFVAIWLFLTLWDLHGSARALWMARQDELTLVRAWRRRLLLWAGILSFWAFLIIGVTQVINGILVDPPRFGGDANNVAVVQQALATHGQAARNGLLGWLLSPLLLLTAPYFSSIRAGTGLLGAGLAWSVPIVALVLHNEWVVRSQVRFEEAALEGARRRSRKADPGARFWRTSARGRARTVFPLGSSGRPEIAILWANLMLIVRWPLHWIALAAVALVAALLGFAASGTMPVWFGAVLPQLAALLIVIPPLLSGRGLRNDLRSNLLKVEMIRPWPMPGWRLFLAQISAPVLIVMMQSLLGVLLLLSTDGMFQLGFLGQGFPGHARLAELLRVPRPLLFPLLVAGVMPLALVVAMLSTGLENLAAVLFPGWVQLGLKKKQAAAKFGQNIVVFFVLSLAMLVGLAPGFLAVVAIVAVQALVWGVTPSGWQVPVLGIIAALPTAAIIAALVAAGGRAWNRLDPSQELLGG